MLSFDSLSNTIYLPDSYNNILRSIDTTYYSPLNIISVQQRNLNQSIVPT